MSLASTSPRRRAWAAALSVAAALVVGTVTSAPAEAASTTWILQTDIGLGWNLSTVDVDDPGLPKTAVTNGLVADFVDASDDGRVVAAVGSGGSSSTPFYDSGHGLLVSVGGSTRLVASVVDTAPVVSSDGASVWFVSDGDMYHYDVASRYVSPRSSQRQFASPANGEVSSFSVSPSGTMAAAVFRTYASTAPYPVVGSQLKLISLNSLVAVPLVVRTFSGGAGVAQAYADAPQWIDESNLVYGVCLTGTCADWKHFAVDPGAGQPWAGTEVAALENSYDVRRIGAQWWFWNDTTDGGAPSTTMSTANLDFSSVLGTLAYPYGSSTGRYLPVTAKPAAFSGATPPLDGAVTKADILPSDLSVAWGARVVYLAFADYLRGVGDQTFDSDAESVYKGTVQFSTDGKRTWRSMGTTSSEVRIPYPGVPGLDGNGRTTVLTRNTWLRWVWAGDAFAARATSPARLIVVKPTITAKAKKKGSKRVVSGTVKRSGGKVALYKGSKKLATATIGTTGAFKFKARTLAKGSYTLKVAADASWGSSTKKLKV